MELWRGLDGCRKRVGQLQKEIKSQLHRSNATSENVTISKKAANPSKGPGDYVREISCHYCEGIR